MLMARLLSRKDVEESHLSKFVNQLLEELELESGDIIMVLSIFPFLECSVCHFCDIASVCNVCDVHEFMKTDTRICLRACMWMSVFLWCAPPSVSLLSLLSNVIALFSNPLFYVSGDPSRCPPVGATKPCMEFCPFFPS